MDENYEKGIVAEFDRLRAAKEAQRPVLHVSTGTIDGVETTYPNGCWKDEELCKYAPPETLVEDLPTQNPWVKITAPIVVMKGGDAFFVVPGAFVDVPLMVVALYSSIVEQIRITIVGAAVAGKRAGVDSDVVLAVANAALRAQLRRLGGSNASDALG